MVYRPLLEFGREMVGEYVDHFAGSPMSRTFNARGLNMGSSDESTRYGRSARERWPALRRRTSTGTTTGTTTRTTARTTARTRRRAARGWGGPTSRTTTATRTTTASWTTTTVTTATTTTTIRITSGRHDRFSMQKSEERDER